MVSKSWLARGAIAGSLVFSSLAAQAQAPAPQTRPRGPTQALDPANGISAVYGTSNLAAPSSAVALTDPATNRLVLSVRPQDLLQFQNTRTQPPATPQAYLAYTHNDALLRTMDKLKVASNLNPTLPVLLEWNHVALDMTSIDHTTAGHKIPVAGAPGGSLPEFEATYAEQFGPPRSSRAMAIVHLAIFEAANTLDHRYASYRPIGAATDFQQRIVARVGSATPINANTASLAAAISEAAYQTLVALYPKKKALLDISRLHIGTMVSAQEGVRSQADADVRVALGTRVGAAAAAVTIDERSSDKADTVDATNRCGPRYPQQPPQTVIPAPLCNEGYFSETVPPPAKPLDWTIDPVLPNPLQLGKNWGLVTPFALAQGQFVSKAGLTLSPGQTIPVSISTDARFVASLNNGAYGPKIDNPRGSGQIFSQYGVRRYGAFNPQQGDVLTFPAGGGSRAATPGDRNPDETKAAQFWGYDATALLCAPPRLYNMIATSFYLDQFHGVAFDAHAAVKAAHHLALVNFALADAGITAWHAKFTYEIARPVTYIRDHIPAETSEDPLWTPLGQVASNGAAPNTTPPLPAYPSGHSVFGAAAFQMIARVLDVDPASPKSSFRFVSDEYNGYTFGRNGQPREYMEVRFRSLNAAKWENAESRIWLGVHWQTDADDGVKLGDAVANAIYSKVLQPLP